MPIKNKCGKKMKGRGIIDKVSNMVLSNKHNRALPGERHQIIYIPPMELTTAPYILDQVQI